MQPANNAAVYLSEAKVGDNPSFKTIQVGCPKVYDAAPVALYYGMVPQSDAFQTYVS